MAKTLAQLRADLQGLAGLTKATPTETDELLNEGHKELCVRAEWTRANLNLGPTVAGQAAYALPSTVYKPRKVSVAGGPYDPADEETVMRITASDGDLELASRGIWWISEDASGVESVSLYPTPGTAGLSIIASCVVYPATLVADGDPIRVPDDFAKPIRDYAASQIYGLTEDNNDLAEYREQKFENGVIRLAQLRRARVGHGNVRMRIEGWTA